MYSIHKSSKQYYEHVVMNQMQSNWEFFSSILRLFEIFFSL